MFLFKMTIKECVYTEPNPFGEEEKIVVTSGNNRAKYFKLSSSEEVAIFPYILVETDKEMSDGTIAEYVKIKKYAARFAVEEEEFAKEEAASAVKRL